MSVTVADDVSQIANNNSIKTDEGPTFNFECFFLFLVTAAIIVCNILVLLITWRTDALNHINKYFVTSLTIADLLIGVVVTPFSLWVAVFNRWLYGTDFCHTTAYISALSWVVSMYSLMWISIDHYLAIRKPNRYDLLMSKSRSILWTIIIWLTAFCFCTAPMFSSIRAIYFEDAYVCIINWKQEKAYFTASGILLTGPALVTLFYTNLYIFTNAYKTAKNDFKKCIPLDPENRPRNYYMSFIVCLMFFISWLPWCILQIIENNELVNAVHVPARLHFYVTWLAFGNAIWRVPIYMVLSKEFKRGFKQVKINWRYILTCRKIPEELAEQLAITQV